MGFRTQKQSDRVRVVANISGPSLTEQSHKKACDVNEILRKYEKSGLPPEMRKGGMFGDFSTVPAYQDALNLVIHAQETFEALGAKVRERFQNDPAKFLEFMGDENNTEEAIQLGLAKRQGPPPSGVPAPKEPEASGA